MEVRDRLIEELKPYPGNPRIPGAAVDKVAGSIKEYGWRQPIVVDEDDVIIVGHTRRLAAIQLGHKTVPVHTATGLSDEKKRGYRLADNRLNQYAKWDEDLLGEELRDLADLGYDMEMTGFSPTELRRYTAADLTETDPVNSAAPRVALGELWQLGEHRLICGDATDPDAVARLLGEDSPTLLVTDPPYGVNYDPSWREQNSRQAGIKNDDRADWREAWRLFTGDVAYVWHGALHAGTVAESLMACGFKIRSQIIWVKPRLTLSRGHYHWQHEPCWYAERHEACWYGVRDGETSHWTGSRGETTVWEMSGDTFISDHPTQKPIEAMARPMMNSAGKDHYVYDPFVGTGTSIIAAERTGRRCLAVELDPHFADIAIARWEAETGQKAVRT